MIFQYTDDCMVGIDLIDNEHRYLFDIINKIAGVVEKSDPEIDMERGLLEDYIEKLIDYGEVHFAHEEKYMEDNNDAELPRQKREHMMFMKKIRAVDITELDNSEKREILKDTLKYLTKWLYKHILGSDTMIGKVRHISDIAKEKGSVCEFTDEYLTGIGSIDEQHRKLFEIIGRAYTLVESEFMIDKYDDIMGILDELEEYTAVHFSDEEEYMEKINYPYINAQKRAHNIFMGKLEDKEFGEADEDQQEYLTDLLDFLFSWLVNHILKMDTQIGKYAAKNDN